MAAKSAFYADLNPAFGAKGQERYAIFHPLPEGGISLLNHLGSFKSRARAEQIATWETYLEEAYAAASEAQRGMVENPNALDCGFAWVQVDPGQHPFVAYCRKQRKAAEEARRMAERAAPDGRAGSALWDRVRRYGSKGYPGGWQFWCPGSFRGQAIGIHEAGARAFRDSLALQRGMGGARVTMGSRFD